MAYFILGLVVGLAAGVAATQQLHQARAKREASLRASSTVAARPPLPDGAEGPPVTRKAAKLGISPADLVPADDILVRMQRAWELGITLEELDAREAAGPGSAPVPSGERDADRRPSPLTTSDVLASGVSTVTDALSVLAADGYDDDLRLGDGGLDCPSCGTTHPTDLVEVDRVFRFEGPSDPADEAIVLGLRCPACGARGSLVSAYGPDADPALADAFVYLARKAGHG